MADRLASPDQEYKYFSNQEYIYFNDQEYIHFILPVTYFPTNLVYPFTHTLSSIPFYSTSTGTCLIPGNGHKNTEFIMCLIVEAIDYIVFSCL